MKNATLRLSDKDDSSQYFDLKFKLEQNSFVRKWIKCVLEAQQKQYPISEPWAVYNINDTLNKDFVKSNLNRLMQEVDQEEKLFGLTINDINDQDTLNKIHSIFEMHHGKLDEWRTNPMFKGKSDKFRKNLSEINQFVHACETIGGSPKIRIVWFDLPKVNRFSQEDYKLFTNKRNFGSLYHLYCDVGKNVEALTEDNDDHHHDVVPNLHFSADCVCYFVNDTDDEVARLTHDHHKYIRENQTYLSSKGYHPNDPRLTTGRIELAKLDMDISEQDLMTELEKYNNIQSFWLS